MKEDLKEIFQKRLYDDESDLIIEEYEEDIDQLIRILDEEKIIIDTYLKPAFANHVVVFLHRVKEDKQLFSDVPEDFTEQVTEGTLETSKKILRFLEEEYGVNISEFELFLFGVYVELSREEELNEQKTGHCYRP